MTTPTTLAETIARLHRDREERRVLRDPYWGPEGTPSLVAGEERPTEWQASIQETDFDLLIACARRCEAIDGVLADGLSGKAFWSEVEGKLLYAAVDVDAYFDSVLCHLLSKAADAAVVSADLRSERDALAKRVGELESTDFMAYTNELAAETARLREENERLQETFESRCEHAHLQAAKADSEARSARERLSDRALEVAGLRADLTAAQGRVRELEAWQLRATEEIGELRTVVSECASAVGAFSDPMCSLDFMKLVPGEVALKLKSLGYVPRAKKVTVAASARPSCIPPDCQHYIELPSGLWAWVNMDRRFVCVEDRVVPGTSWAVLPDENYVYAVRRLGARFRDAVSEPDFLAARALGVRVLGWKS
jgi:hypothetical protein